MVPYVLLRVLKYAKGPCNSPKTLRLRFRVRGAMVAPFFLSIVLLRGAGQGGRAW